MPPPLWHISIYDLVIPAGVIWLVRGPAVLRLGFYVSGKRADNWLIDRITPCLAAYLKVKVLRRAAEKPGGLRDGRISFY